MGKPALLYPNIEAERARRGWTVDELLEKINVKSRKTYYNWCRREKSLSRNSTALLMCLSVRPIICLASSRTSKRRKNERISRKRTHSD